MRRVLPVVLVLLAACGQAPRRSDFAPFDLHINRHATVHLPQAPAAARVCAVLSFLESDCLWRGDSLRLSAAYVVRCVAGSRPTAPAASLQASGVALLRAVGQCGLVSEAAYPSTGLGRWPDDRFFARLHPGAAAACLDSLCGGRRPAAFYLDGARYTPAEFGRMVAGSGAFEALTSFPALPYGTCVSLPLPGFAARDGFRNLPPNALMDTLDATLARGQTLLWEGDVSEPGCDTGRGLALLPPQTRVTPHLRQACLDHGLTTADALLHLVGTAVSRRGGERFYVARHPAAQSAPARGLMLLSADYIRLKTIALYRRSGKGSL